MVIIECVITVAIVGIMAIEVDAKDGYHCGRTEIIPYIWSNVANRIPAFRNVEEESVFYKGLVISDAASPGIFLNLYPNLYCKKTDPNFPIAIVNQIHSTHINVVRFLLELDGKSALSDDQILNIPPKKFSTQKMEERVHKIGVFWRVPKNNDPRNLTAELKIEVCCSIACENNCAKCDASGKCLATTTTASTTTTTTTTPTTTTTTTASTTTTTANSANIASSAVPKEEADKRLGSESPSCLASRPLSILWNTRSDNKELGTRSGRGREEYDLQCDQKSMECVLNFYLKEFCEPSNTASKSYPVLTNMEISMDDIEMLNGNDGSGDKKLVEWPESQSMFTPPDIEIENGNYTMTFKLKNWRTSKLLVAVDVCCTSKQICPSGHFNLNNGAVCYKIVEEAKTWGEALEYCRYDAGHGRLALLDADRAAQLAEKLRTDEGLQSTLTKDANPVYVGIKKNYGDCGARTYNFNTEDEQFTVDTTWWHKKMNRTTCFPYMETCANFLFIKSQNIFEWHETNCAKTIALLCEYPIKIAGYIAGYHDIYV